MRTSQTILTDENQQRRFATTIYPTINTTQDTLILTTSAERLDKLAQTFYNDSSLWWVIAAANNIGKGTYIIPPNTNIRIPKIDNILDNVLQKNKNR